MVLSNQAPEARTAEEDFPPRGRAWYLVFVMIMVMLLGAVDRHILKLLVPMIQDDLGLSDTEISLLNGLAFIGLHALFLMFVGWAADRYNKRTIIMVGLFIWSMMTGLSGLATSFLALFILRAGVGAGESVVVPAGYSLVMSSFPAAMRGRVMGLVAATHTVGGGLALIFGGLLIGLLGAAPRDLPFIGLTQTWQAVFLIMGLCGLPILLLLLTVNDYGYNKRRRFSQPTQIKPQDRSIRLMGLFRGQPQTFGGLFLVTTCNSVAGLGIGVWAPTHFIRLFALPPQEVGLYVGTAMMIGGLVGAVGITSLSDRWVQSGARGGRMHAHYLLLGLALCGVAMLCKGPTPFVAALGLGLIALAMNAVNAIGFALLQDLTPHEMRGRVTASLQFCVTVLSYSIGPFAIAVFTDYVFGDKARLGDSILTVAIMLFGTAIIGAVVARRGLERHHGAAPAR